MIFLTRRATFSASHYYWNEAWTAEENERVFGRCANRNGHGHNYTLEVTVAGEPDAVTGFVVDLKWLKDVMEQEVLAAYDHRHLNLEVRRVCRGQADSNHGKHCDCGVEAAGAGSDGGGRSAIEPGSGVRDAGDFCGIPGRAMNSAPGSAGKAYFGRRAIC
jgi:6-pyruvoyl tetrahydropterin synthase/QueD family protein